MNAHGIARVSFVCLAWLCAAAGPVGLAAQDLLDHSQGELVGEVTTTTALLQSRLTAVRGPLLDSRGDVPGREGVACFEYGTTADLKEARRTEWLEARADRDFIVRAPLADLRPATRYYYRLVFGVEREFTEPGPTRSFKTLPAADSTAELSFCMGSCMNYAPFMYGKKGDGVGAAPEEDRRLGFPAFAAMKKLAPDFFIGTGDIVYYDNPAKGAAVDLPELRKKWHQQFRLPRLVEFFAQTPAYWSKDDHDFRFNDADLGGGKKPTPQTGIELFREQLPIFPAGDVTTPTYRTRRVHKHLQLWFTEGRDYRSPNAMPDGPQKSLWGPEQKAWLMKTLAESDATWKVIISPTPMVGPDRNSKKDNHANLNGFRYEADEFFAWLRANGLERNTMTLCGDRHWQFHSIHPSGFEEFACGALNDENAISGVKPGTPTSTDPEGMIKQPFLYSKPSGGFLRVIVAEEEARKPRLAIEFYNDEGERLYGVVK